jgi:hypothetical protein
MRIVVLLSIFFVIVAGTWLTEKRMAAWERPILVTVYPVVADGAEATARFAHRLDGDAFKDINAFFEREARPYGFTVSPPFRFQLAEPLTELPPEPPDRHAVVSIAWWSLKMRFWAWRRDTQDDLISPDIQMFVLYHSVEQNPELGISVGMRKGRYGIVKAYASRAMLPTNNVVFTHELLHVLGATDKYAMGTGEPIYPDGYAEPNRVPVLPQRYAEIMGGRIPVAHGVSRMPRSLDTCRIGRITAQEIGFFARLQK